MIRSIHRAGLLALALTSGGCALSFDGANLGVPASLAEPAQTPPQGEPFSVTKHPVFLFWGVATVSRPNAEDVLISQVGAGRRIANLRIKVRSRWSDVLVTALTLGVIVPKSVTFEGVIVPR